MYFITRHMQPHVLVYKIRVIFMGVWLIPQRCFWTTCGCIGRGSGRTCGSFRGCCHYLCVSEHYSCRWSCCSCKDYLQTDYYLLKENYSLATSNKIKWRPIHIDRHQTINTHNTINTKNHSWSWSCSVSVPPSALKTILRATSVWLPAASVHHTIRW